MRFHEVSPKILLNFTPIYKAKAVGTALLKRKRRKKKKMMELIVTDMTQMILKIETVTIKMEETKKLKVLKKKMSVKAAAI